MSRDPVGGTGGMVGPHVLRRGPNFLDELRKWMPSNWKIPGIVITTSSNETQICLHRYLSCSGQSPPKDAK